MGTTLLIFIPVIIYGIVSWLLHRLTNQTLQFNLRLATVLICLSYLYVNHFVKGNGNLPVLLGITAYLLGSFAWPYFKGKKKADDSKMRE